MKKLSFVVLSLLSLNAMALDRAAFTGEYKLEKAVVGICPQVLKVETTTFLNETSSPSLQFYCEYESEGCTRLVYQLPDINSGKLKNVIENPMSGIFDSISYTHQTLKGNTITAEGKLTDLFGRVHWQDKFKATLEGSKLSYEFSEINNISGSTPNTESSCIYKRK